MLQRRALEQAWEVGSLHEAGVDRDAVEAALQIVNLDALLRRNAGTCSVTTVTGSTVSWSMCACCAWCARIAGTPTGFAVNTTAVPGTRQPHPVKMDSRS